MGDVINLNRYRKRKQREDQQRRAETNRVRHGRTKAERRRVAKERELADTKHEGHRLADSDQNKSVEPASEPKISEPSKETPTVSSRRPLSDSDPSVDPQ